MSFKNRWQRDKLRKRINKGSRGYPAATDPTPRPNGSKSEHVGGQARSFNTKARNRSL